MAGSSHGHTPAAWTGVTIAFIGFCVSGAFMVMAEPLGFWAGMAIVVLGGVVGMIMRSMGLGQPKDAHAVYEGAVTKSAATASATPEPAAAKS
ncbi:HGxxPAAW family protein [Streptomyces sp. NPDC002643]